MPAFETGRNNTNFTVIGKVPGYNTQINKKERGINYEERLKNNLTTINLRPTGYLVDFGQISATLLKSLGLKNTTGSDTTNGLYEMGGLTPLQSVPLVDGTSTKTAVRLWHELLWHNDMSNSSDKNLPADLTSNIDELRILATNDSTMSEVFGNTFEMSSAEKLTNSISGLPISQKVQQIKKGASLDSTYGLKLLSENNGDNALLNLGAGKALGIQTALPKEWTRSEYTNSLQLMIKLVSPSGHPDAIKKYILEPLKMLILATAPISYDGLNFGYPTLWEVEAEGLMSIPLAGISAMTITRGGNETQFNQYNQPLNVDVRLTIEPLINGFVASMDKTKTENFIAPNIKHLDRSFKQGATVPANRAFKTIKL
jgi:hypothetical protein